MLLLLKSILFTVFFAFVSTIGSLLNVCIYRIPLGETVITALPHFYCMGYGAGQK